MLGKNVLILDSMDGTESISQPFHFFVVAHTLNTEIDCKALLGTEASITLTLDKKIRHFSGIIASIEQGETRESSNNADDIYFFYELHLRPKLWLLSFTKDYRIFQNQYTSDIIIQVLTENNVTNVENRVSQASRSIRSYCVQYGESCLQFIMRLMEEEGISYYFHFTEYGHKLILADRNNIDSPIYTNLPLMKKVIHGTPEMNQINAFRNQHQVVSSQYKAVDYNYMMPSLPLSSHIAGKGIGGSIYEYPAKFDNLQTGEFLASRRISELEWPQNIFSAHSTAPLLGAATTFVLTGHPSVNLNGTYFVYELTHQITRYPMYNQASSLNLEDGHTNGRNQFFKNPKESPLFLNLYDNKLSAIPDNIQYVPVRSTPKPKIYSNQTAIVVGPQNEDIYCDNLGRVKVQFHWDIRGNFDTNSSCWIRVAQNWAGSGWGGLVIPRIGMEVIVTFIDGDPDQPIITGCVYNADNMPPNYAVTNPTKSTFKTNSTRKVDCYNEFSMDDAIGKEEIRVTAAKDMTMNVSGNYSVTLKSGDSNTTLVSGNMDELLNNGDKTLTLSAGNYAISLAKGGIQIKAVGDISITSNGTLDLSGNNINLSATNSISISSLNTIGITAGVSVGMSFPGMLPTFPINTMPITGFSSPKDIPVETTVMSKEPDSIVVTDPNFLSVSKPLVSTSMLHMESTKVIDETAEAKNATTQSGAEITTKTTLTLSDADKAAQAILSGLLRDI
ncbi:MAG: type VI secretion system tip protein TssI/VgrG [Candidatus Paracaedibacteraceae bacterium]|nr:type VI secretion system tip protein TssI/VgrG [Candidatus Paracaedibacteraceae bacterium]